MQEWRLRTAQRSFYRPATARRVGEGQLGQSSRGKKSQSAYLLAPWILCRGESKSSPPARMDGQSRKSHPWRSNPNRRPGTIARTTDSGWNAKGKPLRAFIGWSGSIPGRCQEGISTIEIESPSRAHPKRSFLYGNQSPRCRDSSGQPGTRTAPLAS